jgi:hypothetical protein
MPLNINYTAIERAVLECASAGVDSIWITVSREHLTLLRKVLGDFIYDPLFFFNMRKVKYAYDYQKRIPIFYCPMRIKDMGLKDSEAFGIINSALCAKRFSSKLSSNLEPVMYYAAFYDAIYHPFVAMTNRPLINSTKNFHFTFNGKTFKDNEPLGFTFSNQQLIDCHAHVRDTGTRKYKTISEFKVDGKWQELLPKEERWSATRYTVDKVFEPVILEGSNSYSLKWFYNMNTWEGYRAYIGGHCTLRRPKKDLRPTNTLERI